MADPREEVSSDEAAEVFRRAAEIDQRKQTGDSRVFDLAALEQAGAEAGLSREAVRQALAEVRAGAPMPEHPDAVVARTLPIWERALETHVDKFMRQQSFRVFRRFEDCTIWVPDRSLGGNLRRTLDFNKNIVIRGVSRVTTCVVAVPGEAERSHVRFELDLAGMRRGWYTLPIAAGIIGVAGVVTGAVLLDPVALVGIAPGAAAVTGGAYVGARAGYRDTSSRVVNGVERFLDRLEHGR